MFKGSMVALVTPMNGEGDIDFDALARLIEWHLQEGTDALVVAGSTGEASSLSDQEYKQLLNFTVERVSSRVPVIAGSGLNDTRKTIERTKLAISTGVDAALVVVPYYNRPTQEGIYQHFAAVANAAPLPIIVYNVPSRTVVDMLPSTVARLIDFANIVGIKEACGDPQRYHELAEILGTQMNLYGGDDSTALPLLQSGGKGIISVVANVVPRAFHELCQAALNQDFGLAEHLNTRLTPLYQALSIATNPIPCKWALAQMGYIHSGIRLPLTPLAPEHEATVKSALIESGCL